MRNPFSGDAPLWVDTTITPEPRISADANVSQQLALMLSRLLKSSLMLGHSYVSIYLEAYSVA
ncbi:MAG: hypothetical protein QOH50_5533 [Kribbellaceae bacterium]|jgi:hypothetical protein|nr:hypothetical protein [Kribbellaceae bacterium]